MDVITNPASCAAVLSKFRKISPNVPQKSAEISLFAKMAYFGVSDGARFKAKNSSEVGQYKKNVIYCIHGSAIWAYFGKVGLVLRFHFERKVLKVRKFPK